MSETEESTGPKTPEPRPVRPARIESQPYTPGKLFTVAVLGAGCALAAYYVFQQLEPEQKRRLRSSAFRGVRKQVRNWVGSDSDGVDDSREDAHEHHPQ